MKLNTKAIAITIIFAALTIALIPLKIPAMYLVGFYYRFWEIPIVAAFLLFGPRCGVSVAVLGTLAELTLFFGPTGVIGPPVAFWVTMNMLLGVYVADRLLKRKASQDRYFGIKKVTYFTVLGTLSRIAISPVVTYVLYSLLIPLVGGPSFSDAYLMAIIPITMLFGATITLYTIPIAYLIARVVSRNLKIGTQF